MPKKTKSLHPTNDKATQADKKKRHRKTPEEILEEMLEDFPELDYFDGLEDLLEEESEWYEISKQ